MSAENNQNQEIIGVVVESLPNALFKVEIDTKNGEKEIVLCFLSGKMRLNRIRVLLGDKVAFINDPYGGKGRIFKRL